MHVTKLLNSGSNCYLNSTLQGISSCPQLLEDFKKLSKEYNSVDMLGVFNKLLDALTDGKQSEINARQNQLFNNWRKTGQQDSFEILSYMLTEIYQKLKKEFINTQSSNSLTQASNNSNESFQKKNDDWLKISLPLRIIFKHEIECCNGHRVSCPSQIYLALHVPIPERLKDYSIQDLVNEFMKDSEIENYICDECKPEMKTDKQVKDKNAKKLTNILLPLPNTICIHLQRTRWKKGSMKKINDKIKIVEDIQIKYKNDEIQSDKQDYCLKSVIVHSGTPFFGHYICYKKVGNIWYYTSDNSIRSVKTKSVPDCQAYILFYEKKKKESLETEL